MPRMEVNRFICLLFGVVLGIDAITGQAAHFRLEEQVGSPERPIAASVRVDDFTSVQALQFSLHWDPDVLRFESVTDFGLPGLGVNSFGVFEIQGQLSVIWDATNLVGESLNDGAILFSLNFAVLGADGAVSDIQFANQPTAPLVVVNLARGEFLSTDGRIVVGLPPEITAPSAVTFAEDQVSDPIAIRVTDDGPEAIGLTARSGDESLIASTGIQLSGEGGDRQLVLEPVADRSGVVMIVLEATDATGGRSEAQIEVTIEAVNDPPTAVDDVFEVMEDADAILIPVLENDTAEPDQNEVLTLTEVTAGMGTGLAELGGNQLRYRPAPDFFGVAEVQYQIDDGRGATASAVLRVTVLPVNDPPTAREDSFEVEEDSEPMVLDVLSNDDIAPDENEVLQVIAVSETSSGGLARLEEGRILFRPAPDFFGEEQFTYTISDGLGESAQAQVSVTVVPKNDPPIAVDDGVSLPEDSVDVFIDVLENDHSGPDPNETLSIEAKTEPSSGGILQLTPDGLFYSPAPNFFGLETFSYTINDGNGGVATGQVTVTVVNDQSDAPVARDDRFALAEDSREEILAVLEDNGNGRDFDPDGDPIRIVEAAVDGDGVVSIDSEEMALIYTPATDFVGAETLSYQITDGLNFATGLVFVTVADANNDPPIAQPDVFEVLEDSSENPLNVLVDNGAGSDSDPEGGDLMVSLVPGGLGLRGSIALSDDAATFLYTPPANFSGVERFDYILSDGLNESRGEVEVTVLNVDNDPPLPRPDLIEVQEDVPNQPLELLLDNGAGLDLDPEGEGLQIASLELPEELDVGELAISDDRERVFYSPLADFTGEFEFSYELSDGELVAGERATVRVRVVNGDNDPPVALDDEFTLDEGSVGAVLPVLGNSTRGFDFDPEGQTVTVVGVVVEGEQGGEVSIGASGSVLLYTPSENFSGEETLVYEISDGLHTSSGRVVVTVINRDDDPPVARDDKVQVLEDSRDHPILVLSDNGNGADFDPEGAAIEVVRLERLGSFLGELTIGETGRTVRYSPFQDFVGTESFRYVVSDGDNESAATVEITVTNSDNDPPLAQADRFLLFDSESESVFRVLEDNGNGPDADPDGDNLVIVRVAEQSDESGTLQIVEGDTAIRYARPSEFSGVDRFIYVISDGVHEVSGEVEVIVTGADNQSPIAQPDEFSVAEDSIDISLPLLADNGSGPDEDPNGETLSIVAVHGPASAGGTVSRSQNGREVIYKPFPDFVGEETFSYTISDGALTASGVVTVQVTPVPDPPSIEAVDDLVLDQWQTTGFFEFAVSDVDTSLESLVVNVSTDRPDILPPERLQLTQTGGLWRAEFELVQDRAGVVNVTIAVSDEESTQEESFRLLVLETVELVGGIPDGFRRASEVFLDFNQNGLRDDTEPGSKLDPDERFSLRVTLADHDRNGDQVLDSQDGFLVVTGGYDPWTGIGARGELMAPIGFRLISPITTLVASLLNGDEGLDVAGAIERAAMLLRIEDLDALRSDLLTDRSSLPTEGGLQGKFVLQNVILDGVVQQVCQLFGGTADRIEADCVAAVYASLSGSEEVLFSSRAAIEDLIIQVGGELGAALSIEVIEFASTVIWEQRERLVAAAANPEASLAIELAAHRLFAGAEIESLMRELGDEGLVRDEHRFRFRGTQVLERLSAFPSHDVIAATNRDSDGLRFLYRSASIDENGRSLDDPILVRDGAHAGALEGVVVAVGGTASVQQDLRVQPLTVRLQEGQRFARLDLSSFVVDDDEVEGEEEAVVQLFFGDEVDESDQAVVRDSLILQIVDDEFAGQFGFTEGRVELVENQLLPVAFVERTGGHAGRAVLQMRMKSTDGDAAATEGEDYLSNPISIEFEPEQTLRRVVVPILDDFRVEPDEMFQLELYQGIEGESGLVSGEHPIVEVLIVNEDFDQAPIITSASTFSTDEDLPLRLEFAVSDDATAVPELSVDVVSLAGTLFTVEALEFNRETSRHSVLVTPLPNAAGEGSVEIRVSDGRQTVAKTIVVSVNSTNDAPLLRVANPGPFRFVEDQAPVLLVRGPVITDLDDDLLTEARISVIAGYQPRVDRLFYSGNVEGIDGIFDPETGVLQLTGQASLAAYEDALQGVFFDNRSQNPTTVERIIAVTVMDSDVSSPPVEIRVSVESVNDPPILGRVESDSLIYLENDPPTLVSSTITIELGDDDVLHGATVRIVVNYQAAEDRLLLEPIPDGLSVQPFDAERGELQISGTASVAVYQSALRSVRFLNLSEHPRTVIREVAFVVSDGELASSAVSRTLQTVPVNDPPFLAPISDFAVSTGSQVRLPLEITDVDSAFEPPIVSIENDPPELLIESSVQVVQQGDQYELQFDVQDGVIGQAEVTITVSDGADNEQRQFLVKVLPSEGMPSLEGPVELVVEEDTETEFLLELVPSGGTRDVNLLRVELADSDLATGELFDGPEGLNQFRLLIRPHPDRFGMSSGRALVSVDGNELEHLFQLNVLPVNDLPEVSGNLSVNAEPGQRISVPFTVKDVETPTNQLIIGTRLDQISDEDRVQLQIEGRGEQQSLVVTLTASVTGVIGAELVVVDGEGGLAVFPIEVRAMDFRPDSIRIQSVENGQIELMWEGGGRLAQSSDVDGPFVPIPEASSPHRIQTELGVLFFRLIQ